MYSMLIFVSVGVGVCVCVCLTHTIKQDMPPLDFISLNQCQMSSGGIFSKLSQINLKLLLPTYLSKTVHLLQIAETMLLFSQCILEHKRVSVTFPLIYRPTFNILSRNFALY